MTTWTARRAKTGDTDRILCGRMVNGQYPCGGLVGRVVEGRIYVSPGLTDAGSPGVFRWSRHAIEQIAQGKSPHTSHQRPATGSPRLHPYRVGRHHFGSLAATAAAIAASAPQGRRIVAASFAWAEITGPCVVPCDHVNGRLPDCHDNAIAMDFPALRG
jgi:hypothetical protein